MTFVKGPDFPTGAVIVGSDGIVAAFRTAAAYADPVPLPQPVPRLSRRLGESRSDAQAAALQALA